MEIPAARKEQIAAKLEKMSIPEMKSLLNRMIGKLRDDPEKKAEYMSYLLDLEDTAQDLEDLNAVIDSGENIDHIENIYLDDLADEQH